MFARRLLISGVREGSFSIQHPSAIKPGFVRWLVTGSNIGRQRWLTRERDLIRSARYVSSSSMTISRGTPAETEPSTDKECKLRYLGGEYEGIAVISMCRHNKRNAMGRNIMTMFLDAVSEVKFSKATRVVIIRSEVPGVFCAGADLKERSEMTNEEVARFVSTVLRDGLSSLANLPQPVIAALDGTAVGGGLEMALACDIRIAADRAKMGLIETSRGLLPGAGGTQRLSRVVGPAIAKELIFTSRIVDGEQAHQLGIVNQVVPQNEAGDAAYLRSLEVAQEIIPHGPVAVRMAKVAINRGIEVDLDTGMKFEEGCYAQVISTKDRIEGLRSFKEKRKPVYIGE